MRSELVFILWVIACGVVGWTILSGLSASNFVVSQIQTGQLIPSTPDPASIIDASNDGAKVYTRDYSKIGVDQYLLFAVVSSTQSEKLASNASTGEGATPKLRGIIGQYGTLKAVFDQPGPGADYVVVGAGNTFGGYQVTAVLADAVSLKATDGSIETLNLRGAGEAP